MAAPRIATPRDPPSSPTASFTAEPIPDLSSGTEAITALVAWGRTMPSPSPTTAKVPLTTRREEPTLSRLNDPIPAVATTMPMTTMILVPKRSASRGLATDATSSPSAPGSTAKPDSSGDSP